MYTHIKYALTHNYTHMCKYTRIHLGRNKNQHLSGAPNELGAQGSEVPIGSHLPSLPQGAERFEYLPQGAERNECLPQGSERNECLPLIADRYECLH